MKVRIFCEGLSDQRFLRDFLSINYDIEVTDQQLKKNEFIFCLGGWSNLAKLKEKITNELEDYISLFFLDADDIHTSDKNGYDETVRFVDDLMKEWNWNKYGLFVFPNNVEKTGEVEDFLEKIINPKNKDIFDCWDNFESCLKSKNQSYNLPAKKSKIYVYHEALHGNSSSEKEKCKDKSRDFKSITLWETDVTKNDYLMSVKKFLDQYLK